MQKRSFVLFIFISIIASLATGCMYRPYGAVYSPYGYGGYAAPSPYPPNVAYPRRAVPYHGTPYAGYRSASPMYQSPMYQPYGGGRRSYGVTPPPTYRPAPYSYGGGNGRSHRR